MTHTRHRRNPGSYLRLPHHSPGAAREAEVDAEVQSPWTPGKKWISETAMSDTPRAPGHCHLQRGTFTQTHTRSPTTPTPDTHSHPHPTPFDLWPVHGTTRTSEKGSSSPSVISEISPSYTDLFRDRRSGPLPFLSPSPRQGWWTSGS